LGRWLAGGVIILVTVAAFVIYQSTQTLPDVVPDPTLMISPTLLPIPATNTPSQTPTPIEYRIVSSKANLSAVVTELYYAADGDNWDLTHLGQFAGHLEGTPTLGKGGNFVLAGHVELKDGSAGPFAQLRLLSKGDPITVIADTQPQPTFEQYVVTDTGKVAPDDFAVMRNHGYEEMTLITCDDWNPKQQTYGSRIIIHARPVDSLKTPTIAPTATRKK